MVKVTLCECGPAYLLRTNRSWWMRLIRSRRLYYCARCDLEMFLTRDALRSLVPDTTTPAPISMSPAGAQTFQLR